MSYKIAVKEVDPLTVVSIRTKMTMENVSEMMDKCYGELFDYINENGDGRFGACIALYHGEEFNPEEMDVECCFSLPEPLPEKGDIKCRILQGGPMAATLHVGPYSQMMGAYDALAKWVEQNGYAYAGAARDIYLNSPCEVPPEELKTEVLFPVKKA